MHAHVQRAVVAHPFGLLLKRLIDILGSFIGLLLLSPVFLVIAAIMMVSSPGPVFFRQKRIGRRGETFRIIKFRTMHVDAEERLRKDADLYRKYTENGYKLPAHQDPRITRLGSFLRKSSLDELPQLINVLLGEMSLVGPRPLVPDEVAIYGERKADLLSARPGITGYWQVSGRSNVPYPERCDLELYYVYNWSLWLDIRILFLTIPSVLKGSGAH